MALDQIALILVIILAVAWLCVVVLGLIAAFPFGIPVLLIIAVAGYLLVGVVRDRLSSKEDDYYERNIKE